MDQQLFDRFTKCAVEVLSVDASKIVLTAHFSDDLDADSLDLVELVMALEEEFGIEVPHNDYADWFTNTNDIVIMLDKHGVKI